MKKAEVFYFTAAEAEKLAIAVAEEIMEEDFKDGHEEKLRIISLANSLLEARMGAMDGPTKSDAIVFRPVARFERDVLESAAFRLGILEVFEYPE